MGLLFVKREKLKVLDLFSGIGGFSLGLERTGGFDTVAFCEIEPFPRAVLAKHWPEVPCYDDVRTLTAERLAADGITSIDVITGGFPCQDISIAGKRAGMGEGTRSGLWSEIVRLVDDLRPKYLIVENVANLLNGPSERPGAWFGRILGDLAERGYDAEWENIPAAALGANHRRERVWVVAHSDKIMRSLLEKGIKNQSALKSSPCMEEGSFLRPDSLSVSMGRLYANPSGGFLRRDDGLPQGMDRIGACGNSIYPPIAEMIGRAILDAA
jgi:DNA (cytosine-5)-methyltransferase 1